MFKKLSNIGDSAVVCDFGDDVNQSINNRVIKLFNFIKKQTELKNIKGLISLGQGVDHILFELSIPKNIKDTLTYQLTCAAIYQGLFLDNINGQVS